MRIIYENTQGGNNNMVYKGWWTASLSYLLSQNIATKFFLISWISSHHNWVMIKLSVELKWCMVPQKGSTQSWVGLCQLLFIIFEIDLNFLWIQESHELYSSYEIFIDLFYWSIHYWFIVLSFIHHFWKLIWQICIHQFFYWLLHLSHLKIIY